MRNVPIKLLFLIKLVPLNLSKRREKKKERERERNKPGI
jgi:hypothetical protein